MSAIAGSISLITGGGSGLGRLVARKLAARGSTIVLWDLSQAALDAVVAQIRDAGGQAHGYICDVSDRQQVAAVAERVRAEVGAVDILVNNAGVVSGQSILDLTAEKIERTFNVNVLGLFWVTKAFLPEMVERNRGHIVSIASASGLIGVAKLGDYAASKWAVVGFDESLRVELKRTAPAVMTTVVCPFYINTGMFRGVKSRFPALLPILEEEYVAERLVAAVAGNRRRLILPRLVFLVPAMRILPVAWFDAIADFLGVNVSMEEFVGRSPTAPERDV